VIERLLGWNLPRLQQPLPRVRFALHASPEYVVLTSSMRESEENNRRTGKFAAKALNFPTPKTEHPATVGGMLGKSDLLS
jgi:hypothetical protein